MNKEEIIIANLSCGGCVNTITKRLSALDGVEQVDVNLESDVVSVSFDDRTDRQVVCAELMAIGYPEATEKNGLLTQLKSVKSCLTGKLSN